MKIVDRYGTVLRCYDNGGKTMDRYTIIPPRWATQYRDRNLWWECLGSSENPYYPQGFGMHCNAIPGPHLGKRVHWRELPPDVQKFALSEYGSLV